MLVKVTTILKSPVKLILCESVLQKKQRHIARKHRKDEVDVNLNSGSDEMSSESWTKVDWGDALLQDQDLPTSLASNDPDAPKAKNTPRSKCPTRSSETRGSSEFWKTSKNTLFFVADLIAISTIRDLATL